MNPIDSVIVSDPHHIMRVGPQTIYIPAWDVVTCDPDPLFLKEDYHYYAALGRT